jgi:hypothetical protein
MRRSLASCTAVAALVLVVALVTSAAATTLGVNSTTLDSFSADLAASTTTTAPDTVRPTVLTREYFDLNADAKIDRIVVTYNEALGTYAGDATNWSLTNRPAGMSINPATVTISGSTVILDWTTLSTAANTSVTNLQLSLNSATVVRDAAGNFALTFTNQAVADKAAPALTLIEMFDVNLNPAPNGKVDRVVATFSETLAAYTAGTTPWTLANVPSAGTLLSVSVATNVATLVLTEGASAANTAVGAFTITLATNASGIRDVGGNQSSFAATAPGDKAPPVLIAVSDVSGATDGSFEQDDSVDFTFSEALNPLTLVSTTTVAVSDPSGNGNDNDLLTMSGLLNSSNLGGIGYIITNNKTATFATSTVAFVALSSNKIVRVTLVNACTGDCADRGSGTGNATFVFNTALKGTDTLSVLGATFSLAMF